MALGSAIHKRSSCTRVPIVSVKSSNRQCWHRISDKNVTYPKKTAQTNDVSEIVKEPLLCSSSFFSQHTQLMSLKAPTFSATVIQWEAKGDGWSPRGRTEYPRWAHWPWYIPDRRVPPSPSKEDIDEVSGTSHKCSDLIPHSLFVV